MADMSHQRWASEDEVALRELAEKGFHIRTVALRLRRSESSIKKKARLLDIRVPAPPRSRFRFS